MEEESKLKRELGIASDRTFNALAIVRSLKRQPQYQAMTELVDLEEALVSIRLRISKALDE